MKLFESIVSTINAMAKKDENLASALSDFIKEELDCYDVHDSIGRFLRNELGLWDPDSQYVKEFNDDYDIWHADDMSGLILTYYHEKAGSIGGVVDNLIINEKIDEYKAWWAKSGRNHTIYEGEQRIKRAVERVIERHTKEWNGELQALNDAAVVRVFGEAA